jgi:hypothetical protein
MLLQAWETRWPAASGCAVERLAQAIIDQLTLARRAA